MRKLSIIFLFSLHLLGNTEFAQFFRLPSLVTHFRYHCQRDPSLGFFSFIAMHYGGDDGDAYDNAAEDQLPCHNHFSEHSYQHTVFSCLPVHPEPPAFPFFVVQGLPLSDHGLLPGFGGPLLRPPRSMRSGRILS